MAFHSSLISAPFIPLYLIYLLNLSCTDCQSSSHLNCNHQRLLIFLLIDKNDHTNVAMLKRAHFSRSISKCSKTWYLTWTWIRLKIVPNMLTQGAHYLYLKKKKNLDVRNIMFNFLQNRSAVKKQKDRRDIGE